MTLLLTKKEEEECARAALRKCVKGHEATAMKSWKDLENRGELARREMCIRDEMIVGEMILSNVWKKCKVQEPETIDAVLLDENLMKKVEGQAHDEQEEQEEMQAENEEEDLLLPVLNNGWQG